MSRKIIFLVMVGLFSLSAQTQETKWYAIIAIRTNPQLESFDCKTNKQVELISEPFVVYNPDEAVKSLVTYQFLDYVYNNHKEKLDQIAGLTRVHWKTILFAKTREDVIAKAKNYGLYTTETSFCSANDNNKLTIYKFPEFKYESERVVEKERIDFLKNYINPKK